MSVNFWPMCINIYHFSNSILINFVFFSWFRIMIASRKRNFLPISRKKVSQHAAIHETPNKFLFCKSSFAVSIGTKFWVCRTKCKTNTNLVTIHIGMYYLFDVKDSKILDHVICLVTCKENLEWWTKVNQAQIKHSEI